MHQEILDHLVQPTIHSAFPLLGVNRHFRRLVLARMLKKLCMKPKITVEGTSFVLTHPKEGAFLKVRFFPSLERTPSFQLQAYTLTLRSLLQMQQAESTFDVGPGIAINDPRELFRLDFAAMEREFMREDSDDEYEPRQTICLYMCVCFAFSLLPALTGLSSRSSYNEKNGRCVFKPVPNFDSICYYISCDPETGEEYDCCDAMVCPPFLLALRFSYDENVLTEARLPSLYSPAAFKLLVRNGSVTPNRTRPSGVMED
jgi:hypothetical protein